MIRLPVKWEALAPLRGLNPEVTESMARLGRLTPIAVRGVNGRPRLQNGLNRLRACEILGRKTVTAVDTETGVVSVLRIKDIIVDQPRRAAGR